MTQSYKKLEHIFKNIGMISDIGAILDWDANVHMPEKSADSRSELFAYLSGLSHSLLSSKEIIELLQEANLDAASLNAWEKANLREMQYSYDHVVAVPEDLSQAIARKSVTCEMQWREARKNKDYKIVKPYIAEVFNLVKQKAQAKADYFKTTPYEALLDGYDKGSKAADIERIFSTLQQFLVPFTNDVIAKQGEVPTANFAMSAELQKTIGFEYAKRMGLNFDKARIDVSTHPFCGGTPDDLRITTRYDEQDFTSGLFGILHEAGHGLYEQNLPLEWRHQPVGNARSLAIHESQSLFVEMQIAKSMAFCEALCREFINHIKPDQLWKKVNFVEKSCIRVEADEVTYPLHIMLRFELEQAIIAGDVTADNLPDAWNEGFKKLFGFYPADDSQGCLQDIHWYMGSIGYFPCYAFGAMNAAQLMHTMKKTIDVKHCISNDQLHKITQWSADNIHSKGSFFETDDLMITATQEKLNEQYFIRYLKDKYI